MLRISQHASYSVPVLNKALDILELLRNSKSDLKMDEIAARTGTTRSTTYRILRTLCCRGYAIQAPDGSFRACQRATGSSGSVSKASLTSDRSREEEAIALVVNMLQRSISQTTQNVGHSAA